MSIPKQIIGELGDLGEKIKNEVVNTPQDMAGKAMESMGMSSSSQKQQGGIIQTILGTGGNTAEGGSGNAKTPFQQMQQAKTQQAKAAVARAALEYLTTPQKPKEPTYHEKQKMEEEQKKEMEKIQKEIEAKQDIPAPKPKPKRGMLFAAKKQSGSETKQNVKSG